MGEGRQEIEDLCMKDTEGYICEGKEADIYESLCKKQLAEEIPDDWTESHHY